MDKKIELTVFTPTYNRAHLLGRLYASLIRQTDSRFEWVIVDDGSEDGTGEKVRAWIEEGRLDIRYFRQAHGGKHRAINRGLDVAEGELFFIVDSDDWITEDAVEKILRRSDTLRKKGLIGLQFRTMNPSGRLIGTPLPKPVMISDPVTLHEIDGVEGDMAEVFVTEIFRNRYRFPEIEGENFMPEAIVWNRMGNEAKMLMIDQPVYYAEYQPDGLTARIVEIRRTSPKGSMTYYSEMASNRRLPYYRRLRAAINYWRFAEEGGPEIEKRWNRVKPLGRLMRKRDER